MVNSKIKVTRLLVLMALCCALMVGNFIIPSSVVEAAAKKATLSATEMTVPVGKLNSKVYWNKDSWQLSNAGSLTVKNKVKGATYQFTSSNTKIVSIGKDGGNLTGVKAGSATITCTQTLKNKKTTVGKCTVTVKNAGFTVSEYDNILSIGSGEFDLKSYYGSQEPLFNITYRNPNATYTVTSSSKDFTIKVIKQDASKAKELTDDKGYQEVLEDYIGKGYFYGYQYTAKKAGTYTITIKETYNKKTKTVGSFKLEVKDTSIAEEKVDLLLGNNMDVFTLINYTKADIVYYFIIKDYDETNVDNNVLQLYSVGSGLSLYANKTGTAEVTVREGSVEGTVIGTVTVVVSEAKCQSITIDEEEYTTYVGDNFSIYYDLEPYETTDKVIIESDNPDILKVEYIPEYEEWIYTPLKVGEVKITIKCGDKTEVCTVIVEE